MDMKSISQQLQDDILKILEAKKPLHPNQQKIDVHEPEKDEITAHDFKKLRADKAAKPMKEEEEQIDELMKSKNGKMHNCATHVEHAEHGKGTTISEEHAEPDENGYVSWYTVQFENGIETIDTADMTIVSESSHMHKKSKTNEAKNPAQQAAIAISLIKAGKKKGTMPKPMEEEDKKKIVSPFDYKNYKSQIPTKPGETAGFDSKKISTGTVYSRKPVKEAMSHQAATTMKHIPNPSPALKKAAKDIKPGIAGYRDRIAMLKAGGVKEDIEQQDEAMEKKADFMDRQKRLAAAGAETAKDPARLKRMSGIPGYTAAMDMAKKSTTKEATEYTFAEYLEAARAQYVDEDAVLVANEAFKNQDITLFADQSQSPEA